MRFENMSIAVHIPIGGLENARGEMMADKAVHAIMRTFFMRNLQL